MANLLPVIRYVILTMKHKYFVLRAGLRTKTPILQLIVHDMSKFTTAELPHYGRQFFGDKSDPDGFARAWLHHQNHNPHHWEYWIPRTGHNRAEGHAGDNMPLAMPEKFVREMIADWLGASRAYTGFWPESLEAWSWLHQARPKIRLHASTADLVDEILENVFTGKQNKENTSERNVRSIIQQCPSSPRRE